MSEVSVDGKYRVVLPKKLRELLGIKPGSVLEAEHDRGAIVLRPKIPVPKPTEALWGIAGKIIEKNPKRVARRAIAGHRRRNVR
jgi:AbrB family looped-hinge helix DNA binding protein